RTLSSPVLARRLTVMEARERPTIVPTEKSVRRPAFSRGRPSLPDQITAYLRSRPLCHKVLSGFQPWISVRCPATSPGRASAGLACQSHQQLEQAGAPPDSGRKRLLRPSITCMTHPSGEFLELQAALA